MKTNIYHITQFEDNSAYLLFSGCGWNCKGCIRLYTNGWDLHLPDSVKENLNKIYGNSLSELKLDLNDVIKILKDNNAKKLHLGGGEPTEDPNIEKILKVLKDNNFWTRLVTNGEFLTDEIIDSVDELCVSIRALDDELHKPYTGRSNKKTLDNFEKFYKTGKIELESIYIPGVVECEEILKIAKYIAKFNKNLRYRIDKFISCGYARNAAPDEVEACLKNVKTILPNAYILPQGIKIYSKCLYPN